MSYEQSALFDMTPNEKHGEVDKTKIEYLQLAFDMGDKKTFYKMCEDLLRVYKFDNYSDLVFKIIKDKYEENKTTSKA